MIKERDSVVAGFMALPSYLECGKLARYMYEFKKI